MKKSFLLIIFLVVSFAVNAQVTDSTVAIVDSSIVSNGLEEPAFGENVTSIISRLLSANNYLNNSDPIKALVLRKRNPVQKNDLFYAIGLLVFLLAIGKRFFPRYFSNMFRVFLNSSLRQSQLMDQLMQEKIPALFFNGFFIAAVAFYLSLLFRRYYQEIDIFNWHVYSIISISLVCMYIIKFLSLKFIGWLTGYNQEAEIYIFIIFLINKILAICLVPIIIVMAFTEISITDIAILLSFIIIGLMLLMRFFRSYGILQNRLNVNGFHFLLYVIAMELLPIAIIYKTGMMFVTKIL